MSQEKERWNPREAEDKKRILEFHQKIEKGLWGEIPQTQKTKEFLALQNPKWPHVTGYMIAARTKNWAGIPPSEITLKALFKRNKTTKQTVFSMLKWGETEMLPWNNFRDGDIVANYEELQLYRKRMSKKTDKNLVKHLDELIKRGEKLYSLKKDEEQITL